MAASRPTWKGFLRLSLVNVPVQAHTAMTTGQGEIHLNQLHESCHSRIRYQKVCPLHGEVDKDEIVMGYEYARGNYVEVTDEEREQAHVASDKSIGIERLVPLDSIDPVYYSGRNYYLLPDGAGANRSYAVLAQAMAEEGRVAVGQVALSGRDQVVVVRPRDGLLVMDILNYEAQLKDTEQFEVPEAKTTDEEMRLAKMLLESTFADDPHLTEYKDTYTDKLREIIEAKVEGQEVVTPPEEEAPPVINLMEALRKSVEERGGAKPEPPPELKRPKKKMAKSMRPAKAKRKKKSS